MTENAPSPAEIKFVATFGPKLDPEEMKRISRRGEALEQTPEFQHAIEAAERNDWDKFLSDIKDVITSALDPWLPLLPAQDLSVTAFYQLRRAVRATAVARAFHDAHPLTLIVRAWNGDKESVVELVKIDRLFLQDNWGIRKAGGIKVAAQFRLHRPSLDQLVC